MHLYLHLQATDYTQTYKKSLKLWGGWLAIKARVKSIEADVRISLDSMQLDLRSADVNAVLPSRPAAGVRVPVMASNRSPCAACGQLFDRLDR